MWADARMWARTSLRAQRWREPTTRRCRHPPVSRRATHPPGFRTTRPPGTLADGTDDCAGTVRSWLVSLGLTDRIASGRAQPDVGQLVGDLFQRHPVPVGERTGVG